MPRSFITALCTVLVLLPVCGLCAEPPFSVGGFTLDRPIADVAPLVIMETALPVRYMENINEVEIRPTEGFKSGLIEYGTCLPGSPIVRIKLKYADGGVDFFEELLKRFKARFGEPAEYRGDPFKNVISWKWSFQDARGNRISLNLYHNVLDEDEKMGNAVKLTLLNRLEDDATCFKKNMANTRETSRQSRRQVRKPAGSLWDAFVPQ
jgi:hypothetical protein